MHIHTVRTKFTFGDRVRFDSVIQRRSGAGIVCAIIFQEDGMVDYMIAVGMKSWGTGETIDEIQPGILESEMTLLDTVEPDATIG